MDAIILIIPALTEERRHTPLAGVITDRWGPTPVELFVDGAEAQIERRGNLIETNDSVKH